MTWSQGTRIHRSANSGSYRLYSKQSVAFGEPSDTQICDITELFNAFLESKLLPHACSWRARLRAELKDDSVKGIFRYRDQLQKLFKTYAKGDGAMSTSEFLKFVRDRQLINSSFSEEEFHNVFNKIQDEEGISCCSRLFGLRRAWARWRDQGICFRQSRTRSRVELFRIHRRYCCYRGI